MTGQDYDHQMGRPGVDPTALRGRLATVAAAIARTEERIADTLERIALTLPHDAAPLRARAAQARRYAMVERNRAATFSHPRIARRRASLLPG